MSLTTDLRLLEHNIADLVARHAGSEDGTDFTAYANDPAGFMRDVLKCDPWAKQIEMAERVRDKPVEKTGVLCVTGNGLGKDWMTARMALWWVYARRGFVILTGPTEFQVKNILMREVRSAFTNVAALPGELYAQELRVSDDCGILAFTSNNADRMTGFHHAQLLICVTEGQGVEEYAYEAALRCCTGAENRLFVYGNPNARSGPFYLAATKGNWDILTVSALEHPNYLSGREDIPGSVTRESVVRMANEYGEDSAMYSAAVLAQFPSQGSVDALVEAEWLEAAYARHAAWPGLRDRPLPVLALDVARSLDRDESVTAVAQGPYVHAVHAWRSRDLVDTAERFLMVADRTRAEWYTAITGDLLEATSTTWHHADQLADWIRERNIPPFALYIDAPGIGSSVVDNCRRWKRHVIEHWGWVPSSDEKRWANLRSEIFWNFRTLLLEGGAALPCHERLHEEALAMSWSLDTKGRILMISKDELRRKLKRSPDHLDAVVNALWAATSTAGRWRSTPIRW